MRAFGAVAVLLLIGAAEAAAAQPVVPPARQPEPAAAASEDFALDIAERRITRPDFEAGTVVQTGAESGGGYLIRVGAVVLARRIDVVLRNVRGHVRFHGDLSPLRERLSTVRRVSP